MWHCRTRMPLSEEEETSCKPPWRLCPKQPVTLCMCLPWISSTQGVLCHLHHTQHLSQRCSINRWDGFWAFKAILKNESEMMHVKVADSDASITSIRNNVTNSTAATLSPRSSETSLSLLGILSRHFLQRVVKASAPEFCVPASHQVQESQYPLQSNSRTATAFSYCMPQEVTSFKARYSSRSPSHNDKADLHTCRVILMSASCAWAVWHHLYQGLRDGGDRR